MNGPRMHNRRAEHRYYFRSGSRVTWRAQVHGARTRRGWIDNTSASGVAFLAIGDRLPGLGDDVTVHLSGDSSRLYHVVRTARFSSGLILFGCRAGAGRLALTDAPVAQTDREHCEEPVGAKEPEESELLMV